MLLLKAPVHVAKRVGWIFVNLAPVMGKNDRRAFCKNLHGAPRDEGRDGLIWWTVVVAGDGRRRRRRMTLL